MLLWLPCAVVCGWVSFFRLEAAPVGQAAFSVLQKCGSVGTRAHQPQPICAHVLLVHRYDTDGSGTFDKLEVLSIINDLKVNSRTLLAPRLGAHCP